MLSKIDRAARKMTEVVKKKQLGRHEELEAVKVELKAVKEKLRLAQVHGKSVEQSRDNALEQSSRTKDILHVTEMNSKIYEIEYKYWSNKLVEAEIRLRATRAENHRLFQAKQKAEQLYRSEERHAKGQDDMVEHLLEELATERARVAELEFDQLDWG